MFGDDELRDDELRDELRDDELRDDAKSATRMRWIWRTMGDDRVRPEHARLEGVIFDEGERDPDEGVPGEAYGCRCWREPIPMRTTARTTAAVERVNRNARARRAARSTRTDAQASESEIEQLPTGAWLVRGVAAIGDIVLDYSDKGLGREFLPREVLADAAPSLVHRPFTLHHEVTHVRPDNWRRASHGMVTRAWMDGPRLRFEGIIGTDEAQREITAGAVYLSTSADVQVDDTPGEWAGERYDRTQTRRHFDNLTLTRDPRAGKEARLRVDGKTHGNDDDMKQIKVKFGTRVAAIAPILWDGLAAIAQVRTDADAGDGEIATGKLTGELPGGKVVELVLPMATIEQVFASLGAAPTPAPTPASEGDEGDKAEADEGDAQAPRMDARQLARRLEQQRDELAYAADVGRRAGPVFGSRTMIGLTPAEIMAQTVSLARTDAHADAGRARQLVDATRRGSLRQRSLAEGELRGLFELALADHERARTDSRSAGANVLDQVRHLEGAPGERTDARRSDKSDKPDRVTAAREAAIARRKKGAAA